MTPRSSEEFTAVLAVYIKESEKKEPGLSDGASSNSNTPAAGGPYFFFFSCTAASGRLQSIDSLVNQMRVMLP